MLDLWLRIARPPWHWLPALLGAAVLLAGDACRADTAADQYGVAAGHYARSRWQLAAQEFAVFLARHPQHPRAAAAEFYLGESLIQLGRYDEARRQFESHLRRADASHTRRALFRLGEASYLAGRHAEAREPLERFRAQHADDPLNAYVLAYLGQIALDEQRPGDAAGLLAEALRRYPDGPMRDPCRYALASAHEQQQDRRAAADLYRALAAERSGPFAPAARFRLAAIAYAEADYTSAAEQFAALESDSRDEPVAAASRYWLGLSQKAQSAWDDAAQTLLAGAQRYARDPLAPAMRYHAAEAMAAAGRLREADRLLDELLRDESAGDWAERALAGRVRAAGELASHDAVDRLAAQFGQRFPDSQLAATVARIQARSLMERHRFREASELLEPLAAGDEASADGAATRYLLALAWQEQGEYGRALTIYDALLPAADHALAQRIAVDRAAALAGLKRWDEAMALLDRSLEQDPDGPQADRCLAELAVCQAAAGKIDRAKQTYARLLERAVKGGLPSSTAHRLAEMAFRAGDHAWAGHLFESLLAADHSAPQAAKALSGLGWSRFSAGDAAGAADAFERLVEHHPDSPLAADARLLLGKSLEQLGRLDDALAQYERLARDHADSSHASSALLATARLHAERGNPREAAVRYEQFTRQFPESQQLDAALYHWSWALRAAKRPDEADALLERVHREHATSRFWADATFRLAERAMERGDAQRAEQLAAKLIDRGASEAAPPSDELVAHSLYLIGQIAVGRRQWERVADPMQKLVTRFPDSSLRTAATYWIAEAAYQQGRSEDALRQFEALDARLDGSREPWTAVIPLRRAQLLTSAKEWRAARELAQATVEKFPGFEQRYELDFILGRCLAAEAKFDEARAAYAAVTGSPAAARTETAAKAQWMIGETYFHQQRYEEAIREYLRVEILYAWPEWQAAALLQAGKCHEALHQPGEAAALFEQVVEKYADTPYAQQAAARLPRTSSKRTD